MKSKLIMFIALIGLTLMFSSCAKVPQVQIDAVTAAIDSVKSVGGDVYVPEVYKALTDSLEATKAQVETQKAKWFPTYKKVKVSLDVLAQAAVDGLAKTEARKTELKAENDALVVEVKALLVTNDELLKKAPKGKEGREALVAIKADLDLAATTVTEVETLIANGDILGANDKIKAVKEKANSIKIELETAIEKVK